MEQSKQELVNRMHFFKKKKKQSKQELVCTLSLKHLRTSDHNKAKYILIKVQSSRQNKVLIKASLMFLFLL